MHRAVKPTVTRRGRPHGSGLGAHRYVVERTIALLHWFRRLTACALGDPRREAFLTLTAAIICRYRLFR